MAIPYNKRTHQCGELRAPQVGQKVRLAGWVDSYRDHGGMAFIDLRDYTGITQVRFNPEGNAAALELARSLRTEDVIVIEGTVVSRGTNINPRIPTGEIEVIGEALDLLSKAEPPPFEISDRTDASEELRLKHRYLDLRRPVMQRVFRMRHVIAKTIRDYFDANGFVEIETPFLTKSTPEGARDYLVPSRVRQGSFYALPQSPQIFKQLFMVAGFERYAQIVRCFRDEDLRADRQPEFTQLDMEMSFVQADDVMTMVEGCAKAIFRNALGIDVRTPLPRMTYQEAMDRFGIDRPDTRFGLELQDVTDLVRGVEFAPFKEAAASGGVVKCIVASGGEALTRKVTDGLTEEIKGIGGVGVPIVKVAAGDAGPAFSTGIAKHVEPLASAICTRTGAKPGDTIFFMPGAYDEVCKYLHHVRTRLAEILKLIPENRWDLLWVVDFPMMTYDPEEKRWFSTHHPFTAPMDEDIPLLDTEPNKARSKAYDLVLNGTEMAGGSIRIHQRDVQARVFNLLGISDEEAQLKFSFLLDGLKYGAPPHGGIAFGLDRWVMVLTKMPSLRDVVAFPKTQRAVCLLTGAPTPVAAKQLDELALISKAPPAI
ncbi:MAG: Aspartate--tRNA ligase [Phycisphaerae bacterium]|nr:Aspartate--tRNA ligase [Phycisphaerae bacterium]